MGYEFLFMIGMLTLVPVALLLLLVYVFIPAYFSAVLFLVVGFGILFVGAFPLLFGDYFRE